MRRPLGSPECISVLFAGLLIAHAAHVVNSVRPDELNVAEFSIADPFNQLPAIHAVPTLQAGSNLEVFLLWKKKLQILVLIFLVNL